MPVTYSIDVARKLLRTTLSGSTTINEVVDHFRTLARDPDCVGDMDVLLDLTRTDFLPETQQFHAVIAEIAALRDKVQFRVFAVVTARDAMFGMVRMFEVMARQYFRATQVFREPAQAEAWLATQQGADHPMP